MNSALQEKSTRSCSRLRNRLERKALACELAAVILLSLLVIDARFSGMGLIVLPVSPFLLRSHFCIGLVLYECQPFIYRVFS